MSERLRFLLSLVLVVGLVACGDDNDDGDDKTPDPDTGLVDVGPDGDDGDDVGDGPGDVTRPDGVDVWAGDQGPDTVHAFEPGDTLGGWIASSLGDDSDDYDVFSVELEAGSILEIEFSFLGDGLFDENGDAMAVAVAFDEGENIGRYLYSIESMGRQMFVPLSGTYLIIVEDLRAGQMAHGGTESVYTLSTRLVEPEAVAASVPAEFDGDLGGGQVHVYAVTADEDGVLLAETFAEREPVGSMADTVLYGWDPEAGELVGFNDDADDTTFDSAMAIAAESGVTYWIVVDPWDNVLDAAYEMTIDVVDDHPTAPRELELDASLEGDIEAPRGGEADTDYFFIELEPGQVVRVEVEGTDELQPSIAVFDEGGFFVAEGRAVENRAAVEFVHAAEAEEAGEFFVLVNDQRNVPTSEDGEPENVGDDEGFGYTIVASAATWTPVTATLPVTDPASIDDVGTYAWYEFEVPANHIVQLLAQTTADDFTPAVGYMTEDGYEIVVESPQVYISGDEAVTVQIGVRDLYFRGGEGYDFTPLFRPIALEGIEFTAVEDDEDNETPESAQALDTLPARISGELTGSSEEDRTTNHYAIELEEGDTLVARAHGDELTDMLLRLMMPDGTTTAVENDYYFGQPGGQFHSALVYDAPAAGTYYLVVEPYCLDVFNNECYGNGPYELDVFIAED